ncbi:hypothetical protein pb186bvf_010782 [Paramecium bursaria]
MIYAYNNYMIKTQIILRTDKPNLIINLCYIFTFDPLQSKIYFPLSIIK